MKRTRQPAEPFRIKSIEPIRCLTRPEREQRLIETGYNLFRIDAADIYIDLLTDSGTSAMSARQWGALMQGDESYAGAASFRRFEQTVREIFRKKLVIPCHQGRSAENLAFSMLVKKGQYVINNTHFDTTRANSIHKGGIPIDLPCPEATTPEPLPFKGNMDVVRLEQFIEKHGADKIALVVMTITNNSVGGQPVSLVNIRQVSDICRKHHIPFFYDAARFAENCYFIKRDEPGFSNKAIRDIAAEMFELCDGVLMSAKKDGLANIGGFIAIDNEDWYRQIADLMIVVEGFPTYGGLAGRDLEALAVGLEEVLDFEVLDFRVRQVAYVGEQVKQAGMPIVEPIGGHAVFIDAGGLLPHIPPGQFPGQAVTVEFYREGGVRVVEIGSLMFGGIDPLTGEKMTPARELVRMTLPRRVYTNSHYDYVAETAGRIAARKEGLRGYKILRQSPLLRHFTCELAPLERETEIVRK
ncbi:MAG: tryptophanase [Candidatus Zixiibacteriota bacterium]